MSGPVCAALTLAAALDLSAGDVAVLLLLAGILLIYAEFNRPGTIVLGAAGMLLFLLGVLKLLPLSISAEAFVLAGLGLSLLVWALRWKLPGWRVAGAIAGTGAMIAALRSMVQFSRVHWTVAILSAVVFGAVTYGLGRIAILAARNKRMPASERQGTVPSRAVNPGAAREKCLPQGRLDVGVSPRESVSDDCR